MFQKLEKQLIAGFDLEKNPFLYRRLVMTTALLVTTLFVFIAFIFINYSMGKYLLSVLDTLVVSATSVALYQLVSKKNLEFAASFVTSILFVFIVFFTYTNKNENFGIIWTLTYPLFVIPILGSRNGLLLLLVFFMIILPMAYLGIGEWDHGLWNRTAFLRYFIVVICVFFTAYFYESSSNSAYDSLIESQKKEQDYLNMLESLSVTDQLTKLNNRRYFDDQFEIEHEKILRYSSKLSLIMVDIDHFKQVNDDYGHQTGDTVLQEFSSLLLSQTRSTDLLSRWGGEEFMLLLPEIDVTSASHIAEKLRQAIEQHRFSHHKKLTASFGVAEVEPNIDSKREAILNVDSALYQAKQEGRNRVVIYHN
ncbi:MAG: GGDEF domain-containing protein [Enterobacterales bacterium]|nr:GGDEF domain-containing protein [Enterobacterales bacterium]